MIPKEGHSAAVVGNNRSRRSHLLVLAILTVGTLVIGPFLTASLTDRQSWWSRGAWIVVGIIIYFVYLWWQARSQERSLEAIKERVRQLEPELRKQVQARSYGTRRQLIEAPLRELDLDVTPRWGWVRDPRLIGPEPLSEEIADDIVAAFESSKNRMLIVGEPGSGKTIAAYSLVEYLDSTEGDERIPLLVNLSAWEAQDDFKAFLIDYLCSSVGGLPRGWPFKQSAISSRLTLIWPSTRRRLLDLLLRAGRGLIFGLILGLVLGLSFTLSELTFGLSLYDLYASLSEGLYFTLVLAPVLGLMLALGSGLLETRSVLIASRTPKEARSRSLIAALTWLFSGLVSGLVVGVVFRLFPNKASTLFWQLVLGLVLGLVAGLVLALRNGGWFVLLQKVAHRRLARAGKLPPNPYDFLEWGVEQQIFRRVGGGVRFRHNLIQQHLAKGSEGTSEG